MADINAALIGLLGVMAGGYLNNFFAEDYRRFRDSQSLAGALAGELESHGDAALQIKKSLELLIDAALPRDRIKLPVEWQEPNSPVFEANAGQIGMLGPDSAKDVAYVYELIRTFRSSIALISKSHADMGPEWMISMANACVEEVEHCEKRGGPLIERLRRHASETYWRRPSTLKQLIVATILVGALLAAAWASGSSSSPTNCTTVFDHAKGVLSTVCK
ncbi:hypothetical protein [Paraburkholderia phosphatilytica]|uniref:hypothetical protein n=1 Tax=Paraburkholderia phosphatilytica TaxID=2282883 RepID=UPI000E4A5B8E|nr:hypothetical protein [Paraburkholderia phosphatilytica]